MSLLNVAISDGEKVNIVDMTLSDETLLSDSIKDPNIFSELVMRYEEAFLRKATHILKNAEEAEDTVQEVFVKIYINAHRFEKREGASFKSWAYTILTNTAFTKYQKLKRQKINQIAMDPEQYDTLPDSSNTRAHEELSDYLLSLLSRLPDNFRRVLELHFIEGHPQEEVARKEGVSVGAIKTRVHRAKKELKKIADTLS